MSRFERWSRAKRGLPVDDSSASEESAYPAESLSSSEVMDDETVDKGAREADEAPEGAAPEEAPPAPGSLDHTLPNPETLEAGSDFSAFMSPGVSSALRRKALRQLWSTGDYNVRDGLNDYDQDFKAQLKPMADKVRQWSKKIEDAVEEPATEDESDPHSGEVDRQESEEEQQDALSADAGSQGGVPLEQRANNPSNGQDQQTQ